MLLDTLKRGGVQRGSSIVLAEIKRVGRESKVRRARDAARHDLSLQLERLCSSSALSVRLGALSRDSECSLTCKPEIAVFGAEHLLLRKPPPAV